MNTMRSTSSPYKFYQNYGIKHHSAVDDSENGLRGLSTTGDGGESKLRNYIEGGGSGLVYSNMIDDSAQGGSSPMDQGGPVTYFQRHPHYSFNH